MSSLLQHRRKSFRGTGAAPAAFDGFGNRSRSFDGVDDIVSIPDNADIPTGAQTICCWVKFNTLNSGASGQDLITHWTTTDSNNASFAIYMPNTSNGKVRFYVSADGQLHVNVEALDAISALEWSHVACVLTPNDSIKIYINGSLSNTLATTGISSLYNSSVDLVLGGRDQVLVTTPLNGKLADVRLYDTDLTATDISDIYNGTDVQTNLVGHWLTDSDNVLDAAGTNHGTNYGTKYSYDNPSPPVEFGRASRLFNGTSDYVNLGDVLNSKLTGSTPTWTISTWLKTDSLDDGLFISKINANTNNRQLYFRVLSTGEVAGIVYEGGTTSANRYGRQTSTGGSITANAWHHVAVSWDYTSTGSYLRIWIDGAEATTLTDYFSNGISDGTIFSGNADVLFGTTDGSAVAHWGGKIADMRIYDTHLTASQILATYNGTNITTNLVGQWLTDNDDVEDKAGTNDGTNFGSTYSYDNPPMDLIPFGQRSRSFASDFVNTNTGFQSVFQSSFSISTWVRFDNGIPSSSEVIFGCQSAAPISRVLIFLDNAGALTFGYFSNGNQSRAEIDQNFANGDTGWFHYTAVVEPTGITIYKDGSVQTLDATDDGDMSAVTMGDYGTDIDCYLGARNLNGTTDLNMTGNIADFRIYDSALSASDVAKIYNRTDDKSNIYAWYLTNSDDVIDHAGTNDGTNFGSTYSADSPS